MELPSAIAKLETSHCSARPAADAATNCAGRVAGRMLPTLHSWVCLFVWAHCQLNEAFRVLKTEVLCLWQENRAIRKRCEMERRSGLHFCAQLQHLARKAANRHGASTRIFGLRLPMPMGLCEFVDQGRNFVTSLMALWWTLNKKIVTRYSTNYMQKKKLIRNKDEN